jgi:hypothetical protein
MRWPTISAYVIDIAFGFQCALAGVVVVMTQRLQFACPKQHVVSLMRHDVICDTCWI